MSDLLDIFEEIAHERDRQDEKFGGPACDDARKNFENWCNDIEAYVVWARQMGRMGSSDKYRRRMKQIAALAVAACQSYDRQEQPDEISKRLENATRRTNDQRT